MSRYVLLRHECENLRSGSHWDLMLEHEGSLRTWALDELPNAWANALQLMGAESDEVPATQLPKHRLSYLDYEGPISVDRGVVRRVCSGTLAWERADQVVWQWTFESGQLTGAASIRESGGAARLSSMAS